jgi:amidase
MAVSAPTGVADRLPVGVQLLGRRYREDTVFDAVEVVEARGGVLAPIDPR